MIVRNQRSPHVRNCRNNATIVPSNNSTARARTTISTVWNSASKKLAKVSPVIEIDRNKHENIYKGVDDHFRYLWTLDTTIFAEDATKFKIGKGRALSKFKPPSQVTFAYKRKYLQQFQTGTCDKELKSWNFQVKHLLNRYCMNTMPTPSSEVLFITCSWKEGKDKRVVPNSYARQLSMWLDDDFGKNQPEPYMSIFIMEAVAGEFLSRQLYARLEEATMAVILLTRDIGSNKGEYYSKPNVYHELGYFMKKLGASRILVLAEDGVIIPSNIGDVVRVNFESKKLALYYEDVINWIYHVNGFLDIEMIKKALEQHVIRIEELVKEKDITVDESNEHRKEIQKMVKSIS